ncbi:hypothetical protein N431DRAFT_120116 [Stipitochalara longipes BDJ]|nr:hypothetical protein N431DRAFT_120116 [Stipitochalara longipes BDJ]
MVLAPSAVHLLPACHSSPSSVCDRRPQFIKNTISLSASNQKKGAVPQQCIFPLQVLLLPTPNQIGLTPIRHIHPLLHHPTANPPPDLNIDT